MTLNDLLTAAYIKNGMLAAGEVLDANLGQYALGEANRLLDQWNIQPLYVWTTVIWLFNVTARPIVVDGNSQYWYTIGPGPQAGNPPQPDFVGVRPNSITRANLILTTATPNVRVPLDIFDVRQWSDETVPALGTAPYPNKLYCDFGFETIYGGTDDQTTGNARIYLHPYPNQAGNQLELFIPNQVARFQAVTDTYSMPQGYEDAFMLSLAERLIEGIRAIPATLAGAASRARASVRSLNSKSPKISTVDSGMPGNKYRGQGNFYDGWPNK